MRKRKENATAKQYAELHETPYTTVVTWLQRVLILAALMVDLPFEIAYWQIPENALKPQLSKGPKPNKKRTATKGATK